MFDEALFVNNKLNSSSQSVRISSKKSYIYETHANKIDIAEIGRILNFINAIKKKHRVSLLPIVINLKNNIFEDKLTYILLECICYNLIEKEGCKLTLLFNCKHSIYNEGIKTSCLKHVNGTREGLDTFKKKFRFDIFQSHFRKIVNYETYSIESTSRMVQDVDNYLKGCGIQKSYRTIVSDIVGELLDNSIEHSHSDCLIDLDVTLDYEKINTNPDDSYCGVNIVVLNFSEILLSDGILQKIKQIENNEYSNTQITPRYYNVIRARSFHSDHWNDNYTEKDFYTIASFQHKISSRKDTFSTGGTGLTQLIRGLQDRSDAYECYMLSADRRYNFIKSILLHDTEDWIGFNKESNFLTALPDRKFIESSDLYLPGTAYNLNFVMKREENNYGTND